MTEFIDLPIEFHDPAVAGRPARRLRTEAVRRLEALAKGHSDMTGAAVNIRELSQSATPHRFEVTVVVYARPDQVVATEKGERAETALKGALTAVERQLRAQREKLSQRWEQPGHHPRLAEIRDTLAAEAPLENGGAAAPDDDDER